MTSSDKRGLIPKLRFPEFREAGEWEEKSLADICHRITNGKANAQDHENDGIYPMFDRSAVIKRSSEFMFDGEAVILPGEGMRFVPKYFRGKFNLHQRAYALMEHQGDARFVYHSLDYLQDSLAKRAVKSTVLSLRLPIVENFVIGCPEPAEQQKIADCLASLDELITLEAQQLDTLKTHKKGVMQQLFPAEGETLPKLRFPEFRDAGEWKIDSIGNIFETTSGGTPSRSEESYWGGNIPWVTTSLVNFGVITGADEFITEDGLNNSSAKLFPEGTTLIAMYGQGKTRGQVALLGIQATTNQACAAILPRKGIETNFVFLSLAGRYEELRDLSNSGGQENLSQGLIREMSFSYPSDIAEQKNIMFCLASLDDLINAQTQKLAAFKIHKKGLMQQLFPIPKEVDA